MKFKTSALMALTMASATVVWASILPAGPTTQTSPPAVGLDSLDDGPLLNELAGRGMNDLLQRAFTLDKTPEDKQNIIKSLASLDQLTHNPKLTPLQRQDAVRSIADQIDALMPALKNDPDPNNLIKLAVLISANGVEREVSILEYWGETDTEKANLKPLADAVVKLYDQAAQTATNQANIIANQIKSPTDPAAAKWQVMNDLAAGCQYQKLRVDYALALSLDKKDPQRAKLIDEALKPDTGLPQWDNADSGIQPMVRFTMAKLNLLKGDYTAANALLDSTLTLLDSTIKADAADAKTPPNVILGLKGTEFEIHCFKVISALEQEDIAGSETALSDARQNQQANFALDKPDMATLELLNYRILALKADKAPPGQEQDSANATAANALGQLRNEFPELKGVIDEQLIARLGTNPDFSKMDPVMLDALMQDGEKEIVGKPPYNKPKLQRAFSAAQEIIRRGGTGQTEVAAVNEAALLEGFFQEFLGDKLGAIHSLLDYVQKHASDPKSKAEFALDHAHNIIAALLNSSPADTHGSTAADIDQVRDEFLLAALSPPFNRYIYAREYANDLRKQGKWADAVKYYRLVPATEAPVDLLNARFDEMFCLIRELDANDKMPSDQRTQMVSDVLGLANTVKTMAGNIIQNSKVETEKTYAHSTLAQTMLDAADIARQEQQDPKAVLAWLNNFEETAQGLSNTNDLLSRALSDRVGAYIQLNQIDAATKSLLQLRKFADANVVAQDMFKLLEISDGQLDKSQTAEDTARDKKDDAALAAAKEQTRDIAKSRALLTGMLVNWAETSTDPKTKASLYRYRTFAAETQRLSANLETDPDTRKKDLMAALDNFKKLLDPENVAMYQANLPPTTSAAARSAPDPAVVLGIGKIDYDLGDWQGARAALDPLVRDEKLGSDTEQSWEASYKLLESMVKLAKAGDPKASMADVQTSIKLLYLNWRDETGGKRYHDKFEALRKEVLPDWKVPPPVTPS